MNVTSPEDAVAALAAAIAEPARARMLYHLADGCAHTSTELAVVAEVAPSTASVHLQRLMAQRLVTVFVQGRHRYYSLGGPEVAAALEALSVLAGRSARPPAVTRAPTRLRAARTCYDHIAGTLGVSLHDRFTSLGWLSNGTDGDHAYDLTPGGVRALTALGIDVEAARALRRRFAFGCVDWSERRPHLGGALGVAVLQLMLEKKWIVRDADSRALIVTNAGRRELLARVGIRG